ncbi:MAG: hypothetical protein ACRDT9_02950, partial [Agromyces sp.]
MTARVDPRTAAERQTELLRIAEAVHLPGGPSWSSVLFRDGRLQSPPDPTDGRPDVALLLAALDGHAGLGEHLAALPGALLRHYLGETLGIARRGPLADRVTVAITADPARCPVTIERETPLRGGKDALGAERRYET